MIGDTGTCCDLRSHPWGISYISRIVRPNFCTGIPSGMSNHLSRRGFLSASAMASGAFLWKGCTTQHVFGDKYATKYTPADVAKAASRSVEPIYVAPARAYLVPYPANRLTKAMAVYPADIVAGMKIGVVALYQKCTHLGCKVPWCASSQWFECPCHAAMFSRVGEHKAGPAPYGLQMFPVSLRKGRIFINTASHSVGAPIGTNTTGQEVEGPHCVGFE